MGAVGEPASYYAPRLSRDGRRIGVDISGSMGAGDIWVFGSDGAPGIRLTSDPANESAPLWSPDGNSLLFLSQKKKGVRDLYRKALAGAEAETPVFESPAQKIPSDWSADGRLVIFTSFESGSGTGYDIWGVFHPRRQGDAPPDHSLQRDAGRLVAGWAMAGLHVRRVGSTGSLRAPFRCFRWKTAPLVGRWQRPRMAG